ncbi:hypothetical protein [Treponema sp.]|uniref:hypothetical protein n=1 Tax=Treponema sp. TaxID=166 RepID=UPI0025CC81B3|nr:hypothetical protein [Treponema sp.]MCR5218535.1 hypothetical protein [Treponema sp.]
MKKFVFVFLLLNILFSLNAQTPEAYIEYIEKIKVEINQEKASGESTTRALRQLRSELSDIYESFESQKYTNSTYDNTLKMSVINYDKVKQGWTFVFSADIAGRKKLFNQKICIPYSVFTGKKFTPVEKMTEHQKEDYEYSVEIYNDLLMNSGIILSARLSYSFKKWAAASEYRFCPDLLVLYENQNGIDKPLIFLSSRDLSSVMFTVKPQVEVRSDFQIKADYEKCQALLEAESDNGLAENNNEEEDSEESIQAGRRAFYLDVELKEKEPVFVRGTLTWAIGTYAFAGATIGYDLTSMENNSVYDFGAVLGFNACITKLFRPFVIGVADISTDNHLTLKPGAGLDFKIGHLMFTAVANYNFDWNLTPVINNVVNASFSDIEREDYVTFSFGMGVTW